MSNDISFKNLPDIVRCGDLTYEYVTEKPACWQKRDKGDTENLLKVKVRIRLPSKAHKKLPYMKTLTRRIIKIAEKNGQCLEEAICTDKLTGRKWKIVKKSCTLKKIGRFLERQNLTKVVHTVESPAVEQYELKRVWTLWDFFLEIYLFFFYKHEEPEYSEPFHSRDPSEDVGLNDPFTKLASRAYQDLEHDFRCHDEGENAGEFTSDYIIIYKDGLLKLVPKDEAKKYKSEAIEALKRCWKHYETEYGKEKSDYAQYLANFKFQNMVQSFHDRDFQGVTPEHIYRMNILTSSVEHQDVQSFACKLQCLNQQLLNVSGEKKLQEVFDERARKKSTIWSKREVRRLLSSVAKLSDKEVVDVTVEDLHRYNLDHNLSWNLYSKLQYTRSVILSVAPTRYKSLEALLEEHPDLEGVWSDQERDDVLDFVRASTITNNSRSDDFFLAHQRLQYYVNVVASTKGNELKQPLKQWLEEKMSEFVGKNSHNSEAARLICKLIGKSNATVGDLVENFEDTSFHLTTEQYERLANIYLRSPEELETAYTGRKILRTLNSPYTQADKHFYKPWVDMQEFLQACEELKEDTIKDPYTKIERTLSAKEKQRRFDEIAVFFLCKKHLFRKHPREGYRVGELIPAPTDEQGNRRWYRVSRLIASHDGLMNYVLEPLGKDSGLETCVISRSTAGSNYNYESEASLKNDANPIKDPGYLGRRHFDRYLDPVRTRHTIPVWVAYQHAAKVDLEKLSTEEAYLHLQKATSELKKGVEHKYHKKSLHEIAGEFDAEINDLMGKRVGLQRWFNSLWILKYTPLAIIQLIFKLFTSDLDAVMKIIMREAHERSRQKIEKESTRKRRKRELQEREDSLKLIKYIEKYAPRDYKGNLDSKYEDLINTLGDHIYRDQRGKVDEKYVETLKEHGYDLKREGWYQERLQAKNQIKELMNQCRSYAHEYKRNPSVETLRQWERVLHVYAEAIGENVEGKPKNGLRYTGHSLGGSTAEVETYLATAGSKRIPVPGTSIHASLYDDPGMAEEDNLEQYQFMLDHMKIIKALDAKINVYHSHDYGDIVPLGGTAHLGGITPLVKEKVKRFIAKHGIKNSGEYHHWLKEKGISPEKATEENVEFYIFEKLHEVFFTVTELKKATSYALEAEIGDYPVKHGTRYESARREQTLILEIANAVGTEKLNIDLDKNLGVITNYLIHIFSDDDEEFKNQYPDCYTSPKECVERFSPDHAEEFLKLEGKVYKGGRLTPDEFRLHNYFKELGLKGVHSHADRLRQKELILSSLRKLPDSEPEKIISDIKKLLAEYNKNRSATTKRLLLSGYKKPLQIIRKIYHQQMLIEADIVRGRAVGGMSITWLDRRQLGEISGMGKEEDENVSERYGLGMFCTSDTMKWLRKHVGEFLFPAFQAHLYDEDARTEAMRKKGHGASILYRNKKSKALVIDEFGGPFVGMR